MKKKKRLPVIEPTWPPASIFDISNYRISSKLLEEFIETLHVLSSHGVKLCLNEKYSGLWLPAATQQDNWRNLSKHCTRIPLMFYLMKSIPVDGSRGPSWKRKSPLLDQVTSSLPQGCFPRCQVVLKRKCFGFFRFRGASNEHRNICLWGGNYTVLWRNKTISTFRLK